MRKLVYAFYDQEFSFKRVIDKYPEAAGEITDCLSGDVDKARRALPRSSRLRFHVSIIPQKRRH